MSNINWYELRRLVGVYSLLARAIWRHLAGASGDTWTRPGGNPAANQSPPAHSQLLTDLSPLDPNPILEPD